MKKIIPLLLLCLISLGVSAQEVVSVDTQSVSLKFILEIALPISVDYDVKNYKLTYTTTDPFGQPDTATGLLSIPDQTALSLPMAVYSHGTVGARDEVPSVEGVLERLLIGGFAGNGYIVVAPDYLGLGDSDGIHPYLHAETEASAGRDLVIAARKWLDEQNITYNEQLFTTGYSQGGHASMALHRMIESGPADDGLEITAAAHLSGPYDISPPEPLQLGLRNPPGSSLAFFVNTLVSYDFVYDLYGGVAGLFVEPYLSVVQRWRAEETDLYEMGEELQDSLMSNNAIVGAMFTDSFQLDVLDADPELVQAYEDNDVYDWTPTAPTLLYYCQGDETVPAAQSIFADSVLRANGADSLLLTNGGDLNHLACATPAGVRALRFFDGFANRFAVSTGTPRELPEVSIYPNPVQRGQSLRLSGLPIAERNYLLYDHLGRVLVSGKTTSVIPLPQDLPKGMVVLRIGLEDGNFLVRKLLVR